MFTPQHALVIGASGGIGGAVVDTLHTRGCTRVSTLSRSADGLDITDEASIQDCLSQIDGPPLDLVFIATGILNVDGHDPERRLAELKADTLARAYAVNAIGPILLIKHLKPRLERTRRAYLTALSARLASIGDNGLGGWYAYRAAKTALNQYLRSAAIELARTHPELVIAALHPGTIPTALSERYARGRYTGTAESAAARLLDVLTSLAPDDSGSFYDYAGDRIPW